MFNSLKTIVNKYTKLSFLRKLSQAIFTFFIIFVGINFVYDFIHFIKDFKENQYSFNILGFNFNKEVTYIRGDKKIVLIGMTHIANKSFYDDLKVRYSNTNFVTLAEGVSDSKGLLKGLSYIKMANLLGVSPQPKMRYIFPNIKNADIDAADINNTEIKALNSVFNNIEQINKAIEYDKTKPYKVFTIDMKDDQIFDLKSSDILLNRNKNLMKRIKIELQNSEQIIVPWGALHLTEIGNYLETEGFTQDRVILNYTYSDNYLWVQYVRWIMYLLVKPNVGFNLIN